MHPQLFFLNSQAENFQMRLNSTVNSFIFGCINRENAPRTFFTKLERRKPPKCVWNSREIPSFLQQLPALAFQQAFGGIACLVLLPSPCNDSSLYLSFIHVCKATSVTHTKRIYRNLLRKETSFVCYTSSVLRKSRHMKQKEKITHCCQDQNSKLLKLKITKIFFLFLRTF